MSEDEEAEGPARGLVDRICSIRHPVLAILVLGVLLRVLLSPLCEAYDADYWDVVVRNIESGAGLYGAEGYYYTPVWGYVLGLTAVLQDIVMQLGETAAMVADALFGAASSGGFTDLPAVVPSLAFLVSVKIPLYVCDTVTAVVVMLLVKEATGDRRKAAAAFLLVYVSPILLMSSGVLAMPDTISAMFAVLTVYLLKRNLPLIAGMTFAMAALTKFFPAFLVFVLVAYIYAKNRDDRRAANRGVILAVIGAAAATIVVLMPQVLDGNLDLAFQFITDRTGSSGDGDLFGSASGYLRVLTYAIVLVFSAYAGWALYRGKGEPFRMLMWACLGVAALSMIYPANTQYLAILVPFLAYWIAAEDRRYMTGWILLGVGALIFATTNFSDLFISLSEWGGLFDTGSLLDMFASWSDPFVGEVSARAVQFAVGGVLQWLGVFWILWTMYSERLIGLVRSRRERRGAEA